MADIHSLPVQAPARKPGPVARIFDNERSSAAYRLRIALHLKGVDAKREHVVIHGPEATHREAAFGGVNPQHLVPAIETTDGTVLTQTLAIIEYLDEVVPEPPLLAGSAESRAAARAVALAIACDTHPFGTPRVHGYLAGTLGLSTDAVREWTRHWVDEGLTAVEGLLKSNRRGRYAIGDSPGLADIFLVPQALVAERLGFDLGRWPAIAEVVGGLRRLPAFRDTAPV